MDVVAPGTSTRVGAVYLAYSLKWFLFFLPPPPPDDDNQIIYGVVFDAGSTGSRARIYKVLRNSSEECQYRLLSEEAFCATPGLSDFAHFPRESVEYLRPLLDYVSDRIPLHKHAHTPLFLRATAGLRLLPEWTANALLESVYSLFNSSNFHLAAQEVVGIMDGIDEGFFAWISLLFLSQRSCIAPCNFSSSSSSSSVSSPQSHSHLHQQAIFDLGGGSFQLTFGASASVDEGPSDDVYNMPSPYLGTQFAPISGKFFAHSYLGLGLITAMHSMFMKSSNRSETGRTHHLLSPCLPTNSTSSTWFYGGINWTVTHGFSGRDSSLSSTESAFDQCFETALGVISECGLGVNRTHHIEYLKHTEIHAMSYMCSITEEVTETILSSPSNGRVPVQWYFDAAKKACASPGLEEPFRCAELTYISALLSHGFDLPMDKYLNLNRRIDGIEIGWPVGFLVDVLLRCS
ncbi:hypothetical protein Aperf_G00000013800 [Anoplocephala perfoliata]